MPCLWCWGGLWEGYSWLAAAHWAACVSVSFGRLLCFVKPGLWLEQRSQADALPLPYWSSLGAQLEAKSSIPAVCAGRPGLTPVSVLPNLALTGTDTPSRGLSKYWSVSSRLLVLILFPASGSPLIFFQCFLIPSLSQYEVS